VFFRVTFNYPGRLLKPSQASGNREKKDLDARRRKIMNEAMGAEWNWERSGNREKTNWGRWFSQRKVSCSGRLGNGGRQEIPTTLSSALREDDSRREGALRDAFKKVGT